MSLLNGHKKVLGLITAIGGVVGILLGAATFYGLWTDKVEAAAVDRRMVNEHDQTLKAIVPKVETCHEVNELQQFRLDRIDRDMAGMAESVKKTNELVQTYLQSQMRRGEIPR